jgi:tetratricopeptide (TPR) repeat protein
LKEAGNDALKASLPSLAAQRYDKAINYCSIAYLEFPIGNSLFLAEHQYLMTKNSGFECRWNPLLKQLVMIRLNLSMCFLKDELNDAKEALSQANLALRELRPFATEKGVVLTGKKLSKKRKDEPDETFKEAKTLQAKAYFRLGSAQLAATDFEEAVNSFDKSAKCSKEVDLEVEAAVVRKLNEAKRRRKEKKEKERKKFKFMFSSKDDDE